MKEILRDIVNLPLRIVMGVGILVLLLFRRDVPQPLWDMVVPPRVATIRPLR